MKTINFTAKEILPSLLDKSKTQTIRLAKPIEPEIDARGCNLYIDGTDGHIKTTIHYKPPRFKVGDKVKVMWNQKNKPFDYYCKHCLKPLSKHPTGEANCDKFGPYRDCFYNIFGTATITEVFEIEIKSVKPYSTRVFYIKRDNEEIECIEEEDISERDGFKSANDMFRWFDKTYDLSTPKRFYVYRWKWDE